MAPQKKKRRPSRKPRLPSPPPVYHSEGAPSFGASPALPATGTLPAATEVSPADALAIVVFSPPTCENVPSTEPSASATISDVPVSPSPSTSRKRRRKVAIPKPKKLRKSTSGKAKLPTSSKAKAKATTSTPLRRSSRQHARPITIDTRVHEIASTSDSEDEAYEQGAEDEQVEQDEEYEQEEEEQAETGPRQKPKRRKPAVPHSRFTITKVGARYFQPHYRLHYSSTLVLAAASHPAH
ncbi:uncharacterized protein LOC131018294 [Salvia miltiorrhiza]|uniref:uncharacterized protein LOC131018294 n=1 Tax=Salvia miltiorrhiza TaxID=226208 RepID=UPI0025AD3D18|nr:uncharacterized protein LOC131018294 [Salvia miltiorrhiza]